MPIKKQFSSNLLVFNLKSRQRVSITLFWKIKFFSKLEQIISGHIPIVHANNEKKKRTDTAQSFHMKIYSNEMHFNFVQFALN